MEVILKKDVDHLGYKNELKSVKAGYARNFLIPKGMAIVANTANKKVLEENVRQRTVKDAKIVEELQKISDVLSAETVKVGAKVSSKGKIFGSITTIQISDAISKLGHTVDRKNISVKEDSIKEVGTYTAKVKLHKEVEFDLNFEVVEE